MGWALTLEYCISAAATARSFGAYIDGIVAAFGGVDPYWVNQIPTGSMFVISPTSALLVLGMSALLLLGVKNSSMFNVSRVLFVAFLLLFSSRSLFSVLSLSLS